MHNELAQGRVGKEPSQERAKGLARSARSWLGSLARGFCSIHFEKIILRGPHLYATISHIVQ
jgi:hypothetical protein